MKRYLVTRHQGTLDLCRRRGVEGEVVTHADASFFARLRRGDQVIGTLPSMLAACVTARGAEFWSVTYDMPTGRDIELTADDLERLNVRFQHLTCLCGARAEKPPQLDEPEARLLLPEAIAAAIERASHLVVSWVRWIERKCVELLGLFYSLVLILLAPSGISGVFTSLTDPKEQGSGWLVIWGIVLTAALCAFIYTVWRLVERAARHKAAIPKRGFELDVIANGIEAWAAPRLPSRLKGQPIGWIFLLLASTITLTTTSLSAQADALQSFVLWSTLCILATWGVFRIGRNAFSLDIQQTEATRVRPRRVVIMQLSLIDLPKDSDGRYLDLEKVIGADDPASLHLSKAQIEQMAALKRLHSGDIQSFEEASHADLARLPWQQNLRVLNVSFAREGHDSARPAELQRHVKGAVIVVTSNESAGQVRVFKQVVERLAKDAGIELDIEERGPLDFFWLDDLQSEFQRIVSELTEGRHGRGRVELSDISIDVTPGGKLNSIIAAATTMTSDMQFTYVEGTKVQTFDVRGRLALRS